MRFLIDAQLPPGLAAWIRSRGLAADHVRDIGLVAASDTEIAAHSEQSGATLVSKDADFLTIRLPDRFAFVWFRCGNATNRAMQTWLAPRWDRVIDLLTEGERLVEVR